MRQVVDLQAEIGEFEALGVQVLAVMTDPAGDLADKADYQGITRIPMLSDADAAMSRSYDALGRGMHSDKPAHVCAGGRGRTHTLARGLLRNVRPRGEYPEGCAGCAW